MGLLATRNSLVLFVTATALFAFSCGAHASPLIGVATTASINKGALEQSPLATSESYITSASFVHNPITGGFGSGTSFANPFGAYEVNSYALGVATASAHAQFSNTITNLTGLAQHYSLSFYIYGGSLLAQQDSALEANENMTSLYSASVSVNSKKVFFSASTITGDNTGITWTKTGTDLNNADDGSDGHYSWQGSYHTVDLGVVEAGLSIDVLIEADTAAISNADLFCTGRYVDSLECSGYSFKTQASSIYGDPINDKQDGKKTASLPGGVFNFSTAPFDVPEPTSISLIFIALGAARFFGRERGLKTV